MRSKKTNEFSKSFTTRKQKPFEIESDQGNEFNKSVFQYSLKLKIIYYFACYSDKGASIAERVFRTICILIKEPVCEKWNASWITELQSVLKKYNNTIHLSL